MGRADDRKVRSMILVASILNVCFLFIMCCVRAVFACIGSVVEVVSLFISDLCPLIRFFR